MGLRKFSSRRIGEAIKTIRLGLGLSQEQFGIEAGDYSQDSVAKWEAGQIPHALVLQRISEMSHPRRSVQWILNNNKPPDEEDSKFTTAGDNKMHMSAPAGGRAQERNPKTRHTVATNVYHINGSHDEGRALSSHLIPKNLPTLSSNPFDIFIDQIRRVVREEILNALQNAQAEPSATSPKEWFRAEELAQQYDLPKTWFEARGREGTIRRMKPGRHMLFLRTDVKKYFDNHNIDPGNNH